MIKKIMKSSYKNFKLIEHSLIKRDITVLRDLNTSPETFRVTVQRIANILAVEICKNLKLRSVSVKSPLEKTRGYILGVDIILIPILRAGLAMVNGFLEIIPEAKVGHIGLERDEETLIPKAYYYKTPAKLKTSKIIITDPMLATGGSASAAVNFLNQKGAEDITFACLVSAPEGVKKLNRDHPDVSIYSAALDRKLNNKGYILPGLGDAGDRTFGTL
jgi:uracil phosphoribosyltransferase